MRVDDIPKRNAVFFGNDEAVLDPAAGRSSTWVEMDERANRFARALSDLGVDKGDRVVMFAPNCGEFLDFFFGCGRSGAIGASVNVRLSPEDIAGYLNDVAEPAACIVHGSLGEAADAWLERVPSLRHVIGTGPGHGRELDLEQLMAAQDATDPGVRVSEDDGYQLAATSGTTGTPKAAVKTHGNAIAALLNWMAEIPIVERGTYLQCIPMFFNPGGPAQIHPVLMKGGRSVLYPAFEPGAYLAAVAEHQVTNSVLVPTMVRMVLDHPDCDAETLASIRDVTIGGSPLPRALLARARDMFGDVFFPFYGMAETYSCGMVLRREEQYTEGTDDQVRRLASCGKPMALIQLRVVDEAGADVLHDNETAGEIWMSGPTVSDEYFRMPEETATAMEGGWMKSGDVAVVDSEGFVTIVDRSKDIIITGGINVYSRDVEEVLHQHPAVSQVAVIGLPDERWGEAIHAVVVLAEEGSASEDDLADFAAERLAGYKKPRSVELVEALPMSATGKVLKRELRERHAPASS